MVAAVVALAVVAALGPRRPMLLCGVVGTILVVWARPSFLITVAFADLVFLVFLTILWTRERRTRREKANLPELSDAMATSLAGGSSVAEALDSARHLAGARLGASMDSMANALRHGVPPRDVMSGWRSGRADHDHETLLLLAAIEVGAAHPSQRGRALMDAADSLRLRRLRREDLTAQAAQARASAVVVTWSPWAVLLVAAAFDPAHLARLISSDLGRWCVVIAAALSLVGSATMRAMISRSGLS